MALTFALHLCSSMYACAHLHGQTYLMRHRTPKPAPHGQGNKAQHLPHNIQHLDWDKGRTGPVPPATQHSPVKNRHQHQHQHSLLRTVLGCSQAHIDIVVFRQSGLQQTSCLPEHKHLCVIADNASSWVDHTQSRGR